MRLFSSQLACLAMVACLWSFAQESTAPAAPRAGAEYSGMYGFRREGEFVQITIEDKGKVSGFVSRYGDQDSDRGAFLNQFFKEGRLDGNKITFATETVHGVSFDFQGMVERGEGKKEGDESFYVLRGTLTEHLTDQDKKATSHSREVALKSFPKDLEPAPAKRN